jgi:probable phosphoglycerate mutase
MDLLFVRHGESDANTRQIFANRGEEGYPLTTLGREQAEKLARDLAGTTFARVYSSPLRRASETAAIIARSRTLPIDTAPALREYDVGAFDGQPYGGAHAWRMRAYHDNEAAWRGGDPGHRLAGGESLTELQARVGVFIGGLPHVHGDTDTILLVGHGGLYRVTLPVLLENVTFDFAHRHPMDHCTVIRARVTGGSLRCNAWGDTLLP